MPKFNPPNPPLKPWLRTVALILLVLLALGIFTYANYNFAVLQPGGTDFLHRWLPVRLMLFEGYRNPYAWEVSEQIQLFRYGGRLALPGEAPCLFAYPYSTAALFVPFAFIENYPLARALFMTLIELAHIAIVILSLQIIGFKPRLVTLPLLMVFALFCSYLTQPLIDGNPSSIAALFIVLCLFFLSKQQDALAGVFLALATFKPQLTLLFFVLVWLWAFSNKRWKVLFTSAAGVVVLMGVSFLFLPEWFTSFLAQMGTYVDVASPNTPATVLVAWFPAMAKWIAFGLSLACGFILAITWFRTWRSGFPQLFWSACLTFTLLPISGITSAKSNFVAILPAFILLIAVLEGRWKHPKFWVDVLILLALVGSWTFHYLAFRLENTMISYLDLVLAPVLMAVLLVVLRKSCIKADQKGS
jgi:hypothetical protein